MVDDDGRRTDEGRAPGACLSYKLTCEPRLRLAKNKTAVYSGISIFLIFDPKRRLWVLVRITSLRRI